MAVAWAGVVGGELRGWEGEVSRPGLEARGG